MANTGSGGAGQKPAQLQVGDRVRMVKMGPALVGKQGTVTEVEHLPRLGRVVYVKVDGRPGEPGSRGFPFPGNSLDSIEKI